MSSTSARHRPANAGHQILGDVGNERRPGGAWRHAIGVDVACTDLERQAAGETYNRRLRRDIVREASRCFVGELRSGIDDLTAVLPVHPGQHKACHEEDAAQMDCYHAVPFLDRDVLDIVGTGDAGVVYEDVKAAERRYCGPRPAARPARGRLRRPG